MRSMTRSSEWMVGEIVLFWESAKDVRVSGLLQSGAVFEYGSSGE